MIVGTGHGGLSWWQSWICVWVGYTIAACFICMTGRIGAMFVHKAFTSFCLIHLQISYSISGCGTQLVRNMGYVTIILSMEFTDACKDLYDRCSTIWYEVQARIGGTLPSLVNLNLTPVPGTCVHLTIAQDLRSSFTKHFLRTILRGHCESARNWTCCSSRYIRDRSSLAWA